MVRIRLTQELLQWLIMPLHMLVRTIGGAYHNQTGISFQPLITFACVPMLALTESAYLQHKDPMSAADCIFVCVHFCARRMCVFLPQGSFTGVSFPWLTICLRVPTRVRRSCVFPSQRVSLSAADYVGACVLSGS